MAASMTVLIPEDFFPLVYIRYLLNGMLLLFLPGYAFVRALLTLSSKNDNFGSIERFALSIGMSFVLASLLGLLLNYTPWGIRVIPITFGLTFLVILFALAALAGEYRKRKVVDKKISVEPLSCA
jgi:uncharacterized membrane protein